ncbi:MAG: hypothetical protein H6718_36135, partial [Polyangiaceae bacterium]|nr:hypothetical protein [Polyangiaceae bacterium]
MKRAVWLSLAFLGACGGKTLGDGFGGEAGSGGSSGSAQGGSAQGGSAQG